MAIDVDKLTVKTDEMRKQWVQMLKMCGDFHFDMAEEFDVEEVSTVHRAWGNAITDAYLLIDMWQLEEEEILVATETPIPPVNITPEKNETK